MAPPCAKQKGQRNATRWPLILAFVREREDHGADILVRASTQALGTTGPESGSLAGKTAATMCLLNLSTAIVPSDMSGSAIQLRRRVRGAQTAGYHRARPGSNPPSSAAVRLRHCPIFRWPSLMLLMRTRRSWVTR